VTYCLFIISWKHYSTWT